MSEDDSLRKHSIPTKETNVPEMEKNLDSIDFLNGEIKALSAQVASIAQKESLATKYLMWCVVVFLGILGLNVYSTAQLDEVTLEAKNEVRAISGAVRPDYINFGRIEPGDSRNLVFYVDFLKSEENESWKLNLTTHPFVEAKGHQATFLGWRFSLQDEFLDWFTSTQSFRDRVTSSEEDRFDRYMRSRREFGQVALHKFGGEPIAVTILPDEPFDTSFNLKVTYSDCGRAKEAAKRLFEKSESADGLGRISLTPLIVKYPLETESFRAEIVLTGVLETMCALQNDSPSDYNETENVRDGVVE